MCKCVLSLCDDASVQVGAGAPLDGAQINRVVLGDDARQINGALSSVPEDASTQDTVVITPQSGHETAYMDYLYYENLRHDMENFINFCIMQGPIGEFEPQSGMETSSVMKMATSKEQNVKFFDKPDEYTVSVNSEMDATRMAQDTHDATLQDFFQRPIKIFEREWVTNGNLIDQFDPWALFFNNKRVNNRLTNYNLMRAKLHLKFVINGNGFQYGRAFAAYLPFNDFDQASNTNEILDVFAFNTQFSQLPKVFLNPTTSMGGEMVLPFVFPKNMVNVPTTEWSALGAILLRPLQFLRHANGADDKATVSVFAWAEDVQLSVLTSNDTNTIVPQSGKECDETEEANATGMISGPATKVARTMNRMSTAPIIGPYASATADVAGATAAMAKLFGYSRPGVTKDPEPYRPTAFSNLATTTVPDTATKITVDDKQELSIDPRIAGLDGHDPMDILTIAKRESLLTKFDWPLNTAPETLLWNCRVSPVLWQEATLSGGAIMLPACAAAALPFEKWTGTINFRFQIVCSTFHKGRVKVVYDPNFVDENEYNTMYTEVIDIADKTDFTISVANGQQITWLDHAVPGRDSLTTQYSTTRYTTKGEGNGVIAMYVVNELTTPNSVATNDIEVNVYVSAGDDFEVTLPSDNFSRYVFKPQSGMEKELNPDAEGTSELNAPVHMEESIIGPTLDPLENIASVYYGESIRSFRPLIKRYALHECVGPLTGTPTVMNNRRAGFPYYRGNVPGAVHTANSGTTPAPYNFVNTLLLHWVTQMHSGYRGSVRYKALPRGPMDDNYVNEVERYDFFLGQSPYISETFAFQNHTTVSAAARAAVIGDKNNPPFERNSLIGMNGMARVHGRVNPNLEFEIPYYSENRFTPGKLLDETSVTTSFDNVPGFLMRTFIDGANTSLVELYVAAGEDFQVYFFSGMPPVFYEAVPPPL